MTIITQCPNCERDLTHEIRHLKQMNGGRDPNFCPYCGTTMHADRTYFQVHRDGLTMPEEYSIEIEALAAATEEGDSVVMVVQSGTYRSTTQVWPTLGTTYSN